MSIKKHQIFYIHGGSTHRSQKDYLKYLKNRKIIIKKKLSWNDAYLDEKFGKDFQIIRPRMPLQDNAKYSDWKLHFERYFPQLKNNLILIGQSLGAIFLAKYLSENKFPKKILSTYLVCPPYDNTLPQESLVNGFKLPVDLSLMEKNNQNLILLFSKNDPVVPVSQAEKYMAKLRNAKIIIYKNKNGHFQIPTFPEIVGMIKKDISEER